MKYFIVSGEKSGDLHAANLAKEIFYLDPNAEIQAWGGDKLRNVGAKVVQDYKDLAIMGFIEILKYLPKIFSLLSKIKSQIKEFNPDLVILVDYGGFNMKVAKWTFANSFKTTYYIPPKVWAWNQKRAYKIKKYIDQVLVIFPFEKDFFSKFGIEAQFVGNPLFDEISNFTENPNFLSENCLENATTIALLPGSRKQEIQNMLSYMKAVSEKFPNWTFLVAGISELDSSIYNEVLGISNIKIIYDDTYNLLRNSKAAIVTSGTATLETALLGVPQVVVYKTAPISYFLAKRLIKVPFISLVNLVAQKAVVKELIQDDYNLVNLESELKLIVENTNYREKQLIEYKKISQILGTKGASKNAAQLVINLINT